MTALQPPSDVLSGASGGGAVAKAMNSQHLQMTIAIILLTLNHPGLDAGSALTIVRRYRGGNCETFLDLTSGIPWTGIGRRALSTARDSAGQYQHRKQADEH